MSINVACSYCSKLFSSRFVSKPTKFCSFKCYRASVNTDTTVTCPNCSKAFTLSKWQLRPNMCCSNKCRNEYDKRTNWVELTCEICQNIFKVKPHKRHQRFCSTDCQSTFLSVALSGNNSVHWKGGTSYKYTFYGGGFRQHLKNKVLKRDNYSCCECATRSSLEVHHKDGDALNNVLDNLITLCKTHHWTAHRKLKTQSRPQR